MANPLSNQILDELTTAVLLVDDGRKVVYVNVAAQVLLDISAQRAAGRLADELLGISAPLQAALADSVEGRSTTFREIELKRPATASTLVVDLTVAPFVGTDQQNHALVELTRVDQLTRLAQEAQLHDRHSASNALISRLGHEIKNPLGGLRGAAQLLHGELPGRELKEYTRIIIHEADRLSALVDRMTGPFRPLLKTRFNLHAVLEHVRKLTLAEVQEGLTFHRDYDPSIPDITGDREQLVQAVLNIVRNAVQAIDGVGRITLVTRIRRQFTLGSRRHRHVLEATINDDGPGIPPAILEDVFSPMVSGRPGGTGLGLTIAQEILSRHGGAIECVSQPGDTRFILYLRVEDSA